MDARLSFTYGIKDWVEPPPRRFVRGEGNHILACPRVPVRRLMDYDADGNLRGGDDNPKNILPVRFCEDLEHNQQILSCCRHPENMDVEAWYSSQVDYEKSIPDIFVMICTADHAPLWDDEKQEWYQPRPNGERWHRRFMVGGGVRPFWA